MRLTYIELDNGRWTYGLKANGKVVWQAPETYPDAYEAAKGATKLYRSK